MVPTYPMPLLPRRSGSSATKPPIVYRSTFAIQRDFGRAEWRKSLICNILTAVISSAPFTIANWPHGLALLGLF